ncbi:MAG: ferrochelatase [Blastocatellia bacterium]|nr:ferrochelatase [Blastocatellia bacterium]
MSPSIRQVASSHQRLGVLLVNLGGPEKIEDVYPFLFNLFSDPEIIQLPFSFLQKPVAWLIATTRRKKSEGYYRKIGNGSPQRALTEKQAAALQAELQRQGLEAKVYVGMVCWHPLFEDVLDQMAADGITHLLILPLFPQFSMTTTGSAAKKLIRLMRERGGMRSMKRSYITRYETQPDYIDALADLTIAKMKEFPDQTPGATLLLFSAHSIPQKYVDRGDPYLRQTQVTVQAVVDRIGALTGHKPRFFLSFQSKVGPVKWLEPSTESTLHRLAEEKEQQVLAIPISFVSEHIETLYEMDILYQELAQTIGLADFRRVPALNCHPRFISGLAELVLKRMARAHRTQVAGGRQ